MKASFTHADKSSICLSVTIKRNLSGSFSGPEGLHLDNKSKAVTSTRVLCTLKIWSHRATGFANNFRTVWAVAEILPCHEPRHSPRTQKRLHLKYWTALRFLIRRNALQLVWWKSSHFFHGIKNLNAGTLACGRIQQEGNQGWDQHCFWGNVWNHHHP